MADNEIINGVGFLGEGASRLRITLKGRGCLEIEIEDRTSGANIRTAKIVLAPNRCRAAARVLSFANGHPNKVRQVMQEAFDKAGGWLTKTIEPYRTHVVGRPRQEEAHG